MIDIDETTYNLLNKEIERTHYNARRYNSISTFGLLYFEGNLTQSTLHKMVRLSDFFLRLNEHYYFFNFHYTDEKNAIKAGENLIFKLDKTLENRKSYLAVDRIDAEETTKSTINRLYQILQESMKRHNNRVEDENILNDIY